MNLFSVAFSLFLLMDSIGLTTKEIAALKQSGELGQVIGRGRDFFYGNLEMQRSYDVFKNAQDILAPHGRVFMSEQMAKDLIRSTGIETFERPLGIPETFKVRISKKGAGVEYVDLHNPHTSVRVMPGKPHSSFPYQHKPYVNHKVNGRTLDKNGNIVPIDSREAHIPLEEFVYREIQ